MRKSYKKIAAVLAIMILALAMTSTSFAENVTKNLKAYYRNITVYKNGAKVNFSNEPFILDDGAGGTTYVPLRDMSAMLGKEVKWDGTNYRIDITDVPDANSIMLQTKVVQQEITIKNLEAKIKELESKVTEKEKEKDSTPTSLSELEKQLNKDYGTYSKVDFDIDLKESKTKKTIDVSIYVDLDDDYSAWNKLDDDDIEDFLQDIVDDILDVYSNYTIEGFINDEDVNEDLYSFTVNKRNKVVLTEESGGSPATMTSKELQDYLEYHHVDNDIVMKIRVIKSSRSTVEIDVYVDPDEWSDLKTSSARKGITNPILNDIKDEFPKADISGHIINNDKTSQKLGSF